MATNTRAASSKSGNTSNTGKSNIPVQQQSNFTTPKQNTTTNSNSTANSSNTPINNDRTPISASKKQGMPFDFSRYHIDPQDYHMEPDQLQHVCKQILWITQLRQCYKTIEEQMRIVAAILPKSSPFYGRVDEVDDMIEWVKFQRELCEENGITHITTTQIEVIDDKQFIHTRTFDVKDAKNQNFRVKTAAVSKDKDIQTDEIYKNNTNNINNTNEIEPPAMHPTVKKLDDIRKKFNTKKLIADCGKGKIGNKTEYEYFAHVRKHATWLVKSWKNSLDTPFDRKNNERLEENVEIVETIISEASNEANTEKSELLIAKAFRNVKASFKELFYTTTKLDNNRNGEWNDRQWNDRQYNRNGEWNDGNDRRYNRNGEWNDRQWNDRQYNRNGEWNDGNDRQYDRQYNRNGAWSGRPWRQEQNSNWRQEREQNRQWYQERNERYARQGESQNERYARQGESQNEQRRNGNTDAKNLNTDAKNLITNILKQIQEGL